VNAEIQGMRLREFRSTEGARGEDGTLNCHTIIHLNENPIVVSRKRRNSGGLQDTAQGSPPGYGFHDRHPPDLPDLPSDLCAQPGL